MMGNWMSVEGKMSNPVRPDERQKLLCLEVAAGPDERQ
jgi:hypothetical protein